MYQAYQFYQKFIVMIIFFYPPYTLSGKFECMRELEQNGFSDSINEYRVKLSGAVFTQHQKRKTNRRVFRWKYYCNTNTTTRTWFSCTTQFY